MIWSDNRAEFAALIKNGVRLPVFAAGSAGLYETVRLAETEREALCSHFRESFVTEAALLKDRLPAKEDMRTLEEKGTAFVYELGEGGVFAGLWNMAEALRCGLDVDLRRIPLCQETVEICEFFGLNPYIVNAKGSFLVAVQDQAICLTEREKTCLTFIGYAGCGNDRIVRYGEHIRYLNRPGKEGD